MKNDHVLVPKRDLLKLPAGMTDEEFAQAYKCFVFTELKIKTPEIAAPAAGDVPIKVAAQKPV